MAVIKIETNFSEINAIHKGIAATSHYCITCNQRSQMCHTLFHMHPNSGGSSLKDCWWQVRGWTRIYGRLTCSAACRSRTAWISRRSSVLTQPYYIQMAGLLHLMTRHYRSECLAKKFNGTRLPTFIKCMCWCDFWSCLIQMRDVTSLNSRVKYILRETSSVKLG